MSEPESRMAAIIAAGLALSPALDPLRAARDTSAQFATAPKSARVVRHRTRNLRRKGG